MLKKPDALLRQCQKCGMQFENYEHLAIHQKRFCSDGDYGTISRLENRLKDFETPKNPQPKNDITSPIPGLHTKDEKFKKALQSDIQSKEIIMQNDIQRLKQDKALIRSKKNQEEEVLADLMKEVELKHERDLRARIERDQIKKDLMDLDKHRLSTLEQEKKLRLEKLALDRDNLKQKETQLIQDIAKLEHDTKVLDQIRDNERRQVQDSVDKLQQRGTENIKVQDYLLQERSDRLAELKLRRENLEFERLRILNEKEQIKKGEYSSPKRPNYGVYAANQMLHSMENLRNTGIDDIRNRISMDQQRLSQLKEEPGNTVKREHIYPDYLSVSPATNPLLNSLVPRTAGYQNNPNNSGIFNHDHLGNALPHLLRKSHTNSHGLNSPFANNANNILATNGLPPNMNPYNGNVYPNQPFVNSPNGFHQAQALGEIQQLKDKYLQGGGNDPAFYRNLENMENFYRGMGKRENHEPLGQQEKIDPQIQAMLDKKAEENSKLKQELELLKAHNKIIDSGSTGNLTLGNMNLRLNGIDGQNKNGFNIYAAGKEFFIQNETRNVDLNEDERMIVGLGGQEVDQLRLLSQLPIGTELYRFKMDQFKELSTTRGEMEKIIQEQRLLKMRRDFEKVRREEDRKFENEKWVDEQRKNIIANRLRKDLSPNKQFKVYDPTEGFIIHWDYLLSVPKRNDSCQIVYGIYINGEEVYPPSMIDPHACEVDTSVTNRCIFGENHAISEIPANANALLIFEVQVFPSKDSPNPRLTSFGWSQLDLFDARRELKRGKFKVPLYECPTDTNQDIDGIRFLTPVQNGVSWMYLRISFPQDDDYGRTQSIYPENTHMEYNIPQIHLRNFRPQNDGQFMNSVMPYPPYDQMAQSRKLTPSVDYYQNQNDYYNQMNQMQNQFPPDHGQQHSVDQTQFLNVPQPHQSQQSGDKLDHSELKEEHSVRLPTPPQNQTVLDTGSKKALQIVIQSVKNHVARSHLKISCALYEEDQIVVDDVGQKCVFNTTTHNPLDLTKRDISMGGLGTSKLSNKAQGQDIIFKEDHVFLKDVHRQIIKNKGKKDYYLMFQVLEKPEPTKIQTDSQTISYKNSDTANYGGMEYDLFGWYLFKLNKAEGGINNGKFVRKIFAPGLRKPPLDMTRVKTMESDIEFIIHEVEWDDDFGDNDLTKSKIGKKKGKKGKSTKSKSNQSKVLNATMNKTMISNNPDIELDNSPFISNTKPQYVDRTFEKGMGVDFYIDGLRFLPDNVTVVKVAVQIVNIDFDVIKSAEANLPDLNSPTYNPLFNFRIEIRPQYFSPTTLAFISIDTIDKASNEPKIVGYSGINLFINRFSKKQPENNNDTDIVLLSGNYQLPIYCQEPFRTKPFNMEKIEQLERLPTASILVRIRQAPLTSDGLRVLNLRDVPRKEWAAKGIWVPRPIYAAKAYNTSYYQIKDSEKELFSVRQGKEDPPLRETAQLLLNAEGINKEMQDEELIAYLDEKIQRKSSTGLIDLLYFAKYRPESGFKFALDGIHNAPTAQPYIGLYMLNPPGDFYVYDDEPNTSKLQLNSVLDWDGPLLSPRFLDGYMTFKDIPFSKNMHLVVDIRTINLLKHPPQFSYVGWTIVPLFTPDGFVLSGVYQIPLFVGEVNQTIIEELAENDPWPHMLDQVKSKKIKYLGQSSIMIRLVDGQREGHYEQPWDFTRVDYRYLPKKDLQKYAYNNNADAKAKQGKLLKTIVPNKGNPQAYQKRITDAFITELGLTQYQNE